MLLKNKRGFTLVELTVVIAISAIIVTMCCGFIATYTKYSYQLGDNQSAIIDITNIQTAVKGWIQEFDNDGFDINCNGKWMRAEDKNRNVYVLDFVDNALVLKKNGVFMKKYAEFRDVEKITFQNDYVYDSESGTTEKTSAIVRCRVTYCDGKYQDLLFTIFHQTERNRYSPTNR